jgi:predicted SAM-dependent methyltransferase
VNIDGSNRARFASWLWPLDRALVRLGILPETSFGRHVKIHDLFQPLPYTDNSVSCIYAGEVWEHFEYPDAARIAADCFRVLAPGGVLRVCVPDGPTFWGRYLELYQEEQSKPLAERSATVLRQHVGLHFQNIMTRRLWFESMGHTHKWQFDDIQLSALFQEVGFTAVGRMPFHVSRIPDVAAVEGSNFCIVEGSKPLGPGR